MDSLGGSLGLDWRDNPAEVKTPVGPGNNGTEHASRISAGNAKLNFALSLFLIPVTEKFCSG